jgi:hypothetical protein
MKKYVKMSLENTAKGTGKKEEKYQDLLGSKEAFNNVAEFWEKNALSIQLIAADELIEYCQNTVFTSEEYAAFTLGLGKIGSVMQAVWSERQALVNQNSFLNNPNSLPIVSD